MDYKFRTKGDTTTITNIKGKKLATFTYAPDPDGAAYTASYPEGTTEEAAETLSQAFLEWVKNTPAEPAATTTESTPSPLPTAPSTMPPPDPVHGTTSIPYMQAAAELMSDAEFHQLYAHRAAELTFRLSEDPRLTAFINRLQKYNS